ncbi:MAG: DnaJ-class molecular chaperone with C-terminal Zn finger domain [Bacteroidetes bacterium HLUCCA01]|nr:MAG: DnaJ-class molecular chaperone with C-terminal Zn finger domain [Bacteroidetes bacterium HLUCCA01]
MWIEILILIVLINAIPVTIALLLSTYLKKKKYLGRNNKLNTQYYRNFEDWKLDYDRFETDYNHNGINFKSSTVIKFNNLATNELEMLKLLGIFGDFDKEMLKKYYRAKIKKNHPDKFIYDEIKFIEANKLCSELTISYKLIYDNYFK